MPTSVVLPCGCEVDLRHGATWVSCPIHDEEDGGAYDVCDFIESPRPRRFVAPCCGAELSKKLEKGEPCTNCGAN